VDNLIHLRLSYPGSCVNGKAGGVADCFRDFGSLAPCVENEEVGLDECNWDVSTTIKAGPHACKAESGFNEGMVLPRAFIPISGATMQPVMLYARKVVESLCDTLRQICFVCSHPCC